METLGEILKEARRRKRLSLPALEKLTKIKRSFLEALEKENWQALPEYPVVHGFVKSTASFLGVDQSKAVALLRRDYPPKKLSMNPKPDVENKFLWSPKITFFVGFTALLIALLGYLGFQYSNFIKPPNLEVTSPREGEVVKQNKVDVRGKVQPDASVFVNNQPALVEDNGNFSASLEIFEGTKEIVIKAKSRSGKETEVRRKIVPELK